VSQIENIAPGLRRWIAWHEEWKDDVGALAVDTDEGVVLIDPIDPPRGLARADHVLLTVFWHGRSTVDVPGAQVWATKRGVRRLRNRGVNVTQTVEDGELPGGIRAIPTARDSEVVYWLPRQKAVVVGDVLLGAGAKPKPTDDPLRLCPERWLGGKSHDDLRASLRPLLELPVQRVLVSHGEPILRGGKNALATVLA
jgi:glyoxylase-like metal-dependent hydrolase (beta-lactamase superfamily II)